MYICLYYYSCIIDELLFYVVEDLYVNDNNY